MSSNVLPGLARHFVTDPEAAVVSALEAAVLVNPALVLDRTNKIVFRNPHTIQDAASKVSLVCGGGSGHEPAWAGFVGYRFLTAAVAGTVFASPAAEQVKKCIAHRLPKDTKGTLVVVKNYTGDVMNFGRAVENARALGKRVEMLVVGDDVGVGRERGGKVGRRGLAGTVLVAKCCGALAESGGSLDDCIQLGNLVATNLVTVAASLSRTHILGRPGHEARDEELRLPSGKVELGMGIHNEPGCAQLDANIGENIETMLRQMLDPTDKDRAYVDIQVEYGHKVVLLMNNFGGLSNLELGAITTEVCRQLRTDYGISPLRVIQGTFVGSLDGRGFSVTLLKMNDTGLGEGRSLLDLLDAPTDCAAWPVGASTAVGVKPQVLIGDELEEQTQEVASMLRVDPQLYSKMLTCGLERIIAVEPEVTRYDTVVGDGDCGTGLKRGAEAVLSALQAHPPGTDLLINLQYAVQAVESSMDGTSGAVYAIFLNSLLRHFRNHGFETHNDVTAVMWASALRDAFRALGSYTPAQKGDRTLVDALAPFIDELAASGDLKAAANAAEKGAEETRGLRASLGRSVYVGGDGYKEVPDPGAFGLAALLQGIASEY